MRYSATSNLRRKVNRQCVLDATTPSLPTKRYVGGGNWSPMSGSWVTSNSSTNHHCVPPDTRPKRNRPKITLPVIKSLRDIQE